MFTKEIIVHLKMLTKLKICSWFFENIHEFEKCCEFSKSSQNLEFFGPLRNGHRGSKTCNEKYLDLQNIVINYVKRINRVKFRATK